MAGMHEAPRKKNKAWLWIAGACVAAAVAVLLYLFLVKPISTVPTLIVETSQKLSAVPNTEFSLDVTVTDLGGEKSVKDYTVRLFNQWGVGDARENNGFLLVLLITPDPDDGDYFLATGDGAEKILSNREADDLLYEALEPDFAVGSYDAGVRKLYMELLKIVENYYGIEIDYTDADVL